MAERAAQGAVSRRARISRERLLSWRPSWRWARSSVRSFLTSFLALAAAFWLLPGTQVTRGTESVATLAIVVLAAGALLRPLITRLTVLTGLVGLLLAGLLAQALVLGVALALVPTVEPFTFLEIVLAAWSTAVAAAVLNWLIDTSSDEVFLGQLLGRAVRRTPAPGAEGPGLLVVQLDGVSEPLLRQAITAGAMPTVSRWMRSGTHSLRRWHTGLPATTPAGQAVLLHGDTTAVPAFRWYDKGRGRTMVVSRPGDVAEVEEHLSTGRGLLADGGTSVSSLFSGDATTRLLTLSDARVPADRGVASYVTLRFGFVRSVTLFLGQVVTEWYQARRQRIRGVVPRVHRGGAFLVLRGLTTVVLRDLNVAVVADQMTRGTPVVFVNFVDYDEVAHHAGPSRPETMRTLENLDRVLAFLHELAGEVGRAYEIVVVSDHGQAQGSTYLQLTGRTLEDTVLELAEQTFAAPAPGTSTTAAPHRAVSQPASDDVVVGDDSERWTPANLLLAGAGGSGRAVVRAARSVADVSERRTRRGTGSGTPGEAAGDGAAADLDGGPVDGQGAEVLVLASGSLAHVYRTDLPGRVARDELDRQHPGWVTALAALPHVGAVLTTRADGALLVEGSGGTRVLVEGPEGPVVLGGHGPDPLAAYGHRAAADVLGLHAREHVGDVVLLGRFDRTLGEVVAFEELVGSHGGLGGWQTDALLLHPEAWGADADSPTSRTDRTLSGTDVHAALVRRLDVLGLREVGDA